MREAELIAAIEVDPDDPAPRIVYADWLEQRGDPRAELVQLDERMWQTPIDPMRVRSLTRRQWALVRGCEPGWHARIRRPSFAEVRRRVGVLAMLDPRRPEHDDVTLAPPLPVATLEAIEARIGGRLPEDYRRFVTELGDGGRIRGGALRSLAANATPALMTPFPLDGTAGEPVALDADDDPPGALQLMAYELRALWLITAGPQAGTIWEETGDGFAPVAPPARTGFLAWYLDQLDEALYWHALRTPDDADVFARDPREVLHVVLAGRGLAEVPEGLRRMRHLRRLNLSNNPIEVLPDWIGELTELEFFELRSTRLRGLPDSIGALRKLGCLDLTGATELATLPDSIGQLSKLVRLVISGGRIRLPLPFADMPRLERSVLGCPLNAVPPSVGRTKLVELTLMDTRLTALPDELAELTELEQLYLNGNRFAQLPAWVSTLPRLRAIDLSDMPSLDIADACRKLARIASLREVHFNRNQLSVLPPDIGLLTQVEALSVVDNGLAALPAELARLTRLTYLGVDDNPLPVDAVQALLPHLAG